MIVVDINVPAVDKNYNFSLNEDVHIKSVIDEVTEMIGQKEHADLCGDIGQLNLFHLSGMRALPRENTLNECGVKNGDTLLLV